MWKLGDDWERIVCIGDLHGDLDALIRILLETSIINGDGNWSDDQSLLVLLGDLNDRGPDSANIISYIMELQRQATASGGCVESLLGNHEMMAAQGDFDYVRSSEVIALESFWFAHLNGLHAIYRGNSPYAKWLRQRPTMISAGRSLFVHAGVESRFMDLDPGEINAIMSSWVGYFQGIEPEPDGATYWLTAEDDEGPLWTRKFNSYDRSGPADKSMLEMLAEYCNRLQVDRIIAGHSPTRLLDFEIAYPHPKFNERVAVIDTGISAFYGGRLSALICEGDKINAQYAERGTSIHPLTKVLRRRAMVQRREIYEADRENY